MATRTSCSWCHELAESPHCPACGHRADLPRTACDCVVCSARVMGAVLGLAEHHELVAAGQNANDAAFTRREAGACRWLATLILARLMFGPGRTPSAGQTCP
ncbi:hypothetical protein [Limnoglobus roseus]|uniref:Uncharacterized protein n=1 Tax=Limnoglobus roseus TaxID=2598579 RepID=A0A5C1AI50_9BACT|nr:hypothetical protein [Limnoglobus roseus]QEL18325.1 hypothetical protein PX52LOC_05346 [Limnoglobus roseus]